MIIKNKDDFNEGKTLDPTEAPEHTIAVAPDRQANCTGCYFDDEKICKRPNVAQYEQLGLPQIGCTPALRKDNCFVIFKVEGEEKPLTINPNIERG